MDKEKIVESLGKAFVLKEVKENQYMIATNGNFPNGKPIVFFLEKTESSWILSDRKQVLKYMNDFYELNSQDVKKCINNVVKVYNLKIQNMVIYTEIEKETNLINRLFDFVMCVGQLVNMYPFFDVPV